MCSKANLQRNFRLWALVEALTIYEPYLTLRFCQSLKSLLRKAYLIAEFQAKRLRHIIVFSMLIKSIFFLHFFTTIEISGYQTVDRSDYRLEICLAKDKVKLGLQKKSRKCIRKKFYYFIILKSFQKFHGKSVIFRKKKNKYWNFNRENCSQKLPGQSFGIANH